MMYYILLPGVDLTSLSLIPEHQAWLKDWLFQIEGGVEEGDVASSLCLQGLIAEIALYQQPKRDWLAVFEDYLTSEEGRPIAYSELFGQRLYRFDGQWRQTPVHAVHSRWWAEKFLNGTVDRKFVNWIKEHLQPNGWIYNPQVSATGQRTRMRSEYRLSFTMGIEILKYHECLDAYQTRFEATLSSEPLAPYLSAESFRLQALDMLDVMHLAPADLGSILTPCEAGIGYADFSMAGKRDDYMGSAKRSERDVAVYSPLSCLHAEHVTTACDASTQAFVQKRLRGFAMHIKDHPLDIPAFRIRDLVEIPFGTSIAPLEVIAASAFIQKYLT